MIDINPKAYGLPAGATIELTVEPECDVTPEDQFSETEDAAWVRSELARGNDYAWCWVRVIVRYAGHTGDDSLGACSYADEASLVRDVVPDLVANAWFEIKRKRVATRKALRTLGVRL